VTPAGTAVSGPRATATTSWPAAAARDTSSVPIAPDAPRIVIFMCLPVFGVNICSSARTSVVGDAEASSIGEAVEHDADDLAST